MNLLFRLFIFILISLLIAKPINPDGKETSVLLENINNNGKNYKYYEIDKTGLQYSQIGEYSKEALQLGKGNLFGASTPHHPVVVWMSVLISFALIAWLAISSLIQVNNKMKEIDNESII